jgi:hypothetical protein
MAVVGLAEGEVGQIVVGRSLLLFSVPTGKRRGQPKPQVESEKFHHDSSTL